MIVISVPWEECCVEDRAMKSSKWWEQWRRNDRIVLGKRGYPLLRWYAEDSRSFCLAMLTRIGIPKESSRALGEKAETASSWIWQLSDIKESKSHNIQRKNTIFVVGCYGFEGPKHPVNFGNRLMMSGESLLVIRGSLSECRQTTPAKCDVWGRTNNQVERVFAKSTRPRGFNWKFANRGGVKVTGLTVDWEIQVRFPAYAHCAWALWWQGG